MFDYGMLSTAGIKDPQVRAFLDRMVQVLREQASNSVDEKAARRIAAKTVADILGGGGGGGGGGAGDGSATPNGDAIDALAENIQKSLVYQVLSQAISLPDIDRLSAQADAALMRVGNNEASINLEKQTRQDGDLALASQIEVVSAKATDEYIQNWNFDRDTEGWTGVNCTVSRVTVASNAYLRLSAPTSANFSAASPTFTDFNGRIYNRVRVKAKRVSGSGWEGNLYYTTAEHGNSASYYKNVPRPANDAVGQWFLLEFDMTQLTAGGTDWYNGATVIKSIRLDLGNTLSDSFDIAWVSIGRADAGGGAATVVVEQEARATKDTALASAINNIWAKLGGSAAVIEDGALAAATPSAAVATKWNQVVASVTDPNTGNVSSASILSETRAYANSADSTLNAVYSVRAQVDANGDTVVGGFGLAATSGAGSATGPRIDVGVLAHRFFIAAPASGYNPATQYDANLQFPFIAVTSPTIINGVTYQPGVYIKKAIIGDASIDTAKIAQHINSNSFNGTFDVNGNIATNGTNGWAIDKSGKAVFNNIVVRGDVQATSINGQIVGSGHIVANSCTIPLSGVTNSSLSLTGTAQTALTLPSFQSKGGSVFLHAAFNVSVISGGTEDPVLTAPVTVRWMRNSTQIFSETFSARTGVLIVPPAVDNPADGTNITYTLDVFTGGGGGSVSISRRRGYALEAVR